MTIEEHGSELTRRKRKDSQALSTLPDRLRSAKYDSFGRLVESEQAHAEAVGGSTPSVQYAYDDSSASDLLTNSGRLASLTYPDGRVLHHDYGTADGLDDRLSTEYRLRETDGSGTILVEYARTGGGGAVVVDYQQPDIKLDLFGGTTGAYAGFDRFRRTVDHRWYDYSAGTVDVARYQYGHDSNSNRLWREDPVAEANSVDIDELYAYDGLNRLTSAERGELNGAHDTISTKNFAQDWSLEQLGNWSNFQQDDDGNGTADLDQDRTHNDANELTEIESSSTHLAHDAAGNMTKAPVPGSWSSHYDLTWDAWNRLVKVESGANTVAEYHYDGHNRRIAKKVYAAGSLDHTEHFYLSNRNQVLEIRLDTDTDPHKQFTRGTRYIDDLTMRTRDTDTNGTLDETLYALQDANWNTTTTADATGTIQERFQYDPYGRTNILDPDFTPDADGISDQDWNYRYTTREYDPETGLFYYRARYYQSTIGRFISRDPIEYADGLNRYQYVASSPNTHRDPSGLQIDEIRAGDRVYFHVYYRGLFQPSTYIASFSAPVAQPHTIDIAREQARLLELRGDLQNLTSAIKAAADTAELAMRIANTPLDMVLSAAEFVEHPSILSFAAIFPIIPGGGNKIDNWVGGITPKRLKGGAVSYPKSGGYAKACEEFAMLVDQVPGGVTIRIKDGGEKIARLRRNDARVHLRQSDGEWTVSLSQKGTKQMKAKYGK